MPNRPDPCWQQHLTEALEKRGRVWGAGNIKELRAESLANEQGDKGADTVPLPRRIIPYMARADE